MHTSVLLHETISLLNPTKGSVYLDATVGSAGHASEVCRLLEGDVTIVGLDADHDALERSRKNLTAAGCGGALLAKANFRTLDAALDALGIEHVDAVLFDLGVSSHQLAGKEEGGAGRGFSFRHDEPLLMTLDSEPGEDALTARTIVNEWPEKELADILKYYGGERYARRIAEAITARRSEAPITTTKELADLVVEAVPKFYERGRIHPATRTFQALRMTVNDEWETLHEGLAKAFERLSTGGRLAVISFHSIEDRAVKRFMREASGRGEASILTKKPVIPQDEEIQANPRARSAKLRGIEKTAQ